MPKRGPSQKWALTEGAEEAEVEGDSRVALVEVAEKVDVDLNVDDKTIHPLYLRPSTALTYVTQLGRSVLKIGRT